MRRRILVLGFVSAVALSTGAAKAGPPLYEPRVVPGVSTVIPAGSCAGESVFEVGSGNRFDLSPPYDKCERLKVVFGPIWSKPGQNDVLIQPVTFEKPFYPGYLTRFKPDLVTADGTSPRVKDVHLHHGTWLNSGFFGSATGSLPVDPMRRYGWGPWIASGEEKTIAVWPKGYGLKILESDVWLFLHMVHNATSQTFPVWVTYDLDFIPAAAAEAKDENGKPAITNTKGIWLDIGDCSWSDACEKDTWNPIFNIQRGRGEIVDGACVFPRENCAHQNTLAGISAQQGADIGTTYDDWKIPIDGTLVMMGGHLHFGGLRDDVYLVRDIDGDGRTDAAEDADTDPVTSADEIRLIHLSDAHYWDQGFDPDAWTPEDNFDLSKNVVGGVPTSWDMVMTGVTKDLGWSIDVKAGDKLRLEGIYDSKLATWYEQMGIVMTWIAPGETSGIDPFDPAVTIEQGLNADAVNPPTTDGYTLPGADLPLCHADETTICVRGQGTHARAPTSGDHWSCELNGCPNIARAAQSGRVMTDIQIGAFTFGPADLAVIGRLGIPVVPLGQTVRFWNADTADYMWHTITRCTNPCSGTTSASYPIADGAYDDLIDPATGLDPDGRSVDDLIAFRGPDAMDFDSGQIGIGTGANNKLDWEFTPTRTGTFTFFCRIHPSMRGAIRVV